jgi:hypothetical protein
MFFIAFALLSKSLYERPTLFASGNPRPILYQIHEQRAHQDCRYHIQDEPCGFILIDRPNGNPGFG